jgi:diguanylate cyclase (GGDEF)-like protein
LVDHAYPGLAANDGRFKLPELVIDTLVVGLVALFGMALAHQARLIPTLWPANGVLLAGLMMSRGRGATRLRLVCGIAAVALATLLAGAELVLCLKLALVNSVEVWLAFFLLNRFAKGDFDLSISAVLWKFAIYAGVMAPLIAAWLNFTLHITSKGASAPFFISAFFAHALGIVTLTPVAVSLKKRSFLDVLSRETILLTLASFAALTVVTLCVFAQSRYPLLFLVYPPLVFLTFSCGLPGGSLAVFLTTLASIVFTVSGTGPASLMKSSTGMERVIVVQLFSAVAALLVLVVSALLAERQRVETQLVKARNELELLASKDGLTNLANRRCLDETLDREYSRALREQTPLSFILLDLDYFKSFNDHYGHQAGDDCLRAVSRAVSGFVRRPGDLAARYGGEELAVILSNTDAAGAAQVAEAVRAKIEALRLPHARSPLSGGAVTASVGVSTLAPGETAGGVQRIVQRADEMLYEAKRRGRNRVVSMSLGGAARQA